MRIQFCKNVGLSPFPRRDNYKIAKKLKDLLMQNQGAILSKLGTKHPWVMKTQVCSIKDPALFQGENYQIAKIHCRN